MMKRKFLAVILPIIGCATVVGSGFSAWYFGQDVVVDTGGNTNIGMNITEEVEATNANLSIDLSATTIDEVGTAYTYTVDANTITAVDESNSYKLTIVYEDTAESLNVTWKDLHGEDTSNGVLTDFVPADSGEETAGYIGTWTGKVGPNDVELVINDDKTLLYNVKDGRLVLDQGGARNNSEDSGIMFGSSTSTVTTETTGEIWGFTVSYDGTSGGDHVPGLSIKELYDAGLIIRVEMSVTLDATLYKYIDFQDTLPEFSVNSDNLGIKDEKATFAPKDDTSGSAVITANYIVDVTKLTDKGAETSIDLTFALDLNTVAKSVEGRTDYSNKLFVYQKNENVRDEQDYTGGKPHFSDDLETMRGEIAGSKIDFTVVGHIEDDPTK